eukprot:Trichotokara_eunicae@DN5564_c0_g2_i2.p1
MEKVLAVHLKTFLAARNPQNVWLQGVVVSISEDTSGEKNVQFDDGSGATVTLQWPPDDDRIIKEGDCFSLVCSYGQENKELKICVAANVENEPNTDLVWINQIVESYLNQVAQYSQ